MAALPENKPARTVLAVRFSALGDVAMTVPAIYDACAQHPDVRFVFVTRPHPATVFINPPANLVVEGVDLDKYHGIAGMWRLAAELRERYAPELLVDLHDVIRTRLLRLFLGLHGVATRHIDKGRREKRALTRAGSKRLVALKPAVERCYDVFRAGGLGLTPRFEGLAAGGPLPLPQCGLRPRAEGERWVALAPFAAHPGKCWPLEQMEKVVDALAVRSGHRVLLFGGGEKEQQKLKLLAGARSNVTVVPSLGLTLASEIALMSHCDVMVSMDSANMHLASLVGVRVVSVWGATHPYAGFMGAGQSDADAVQLAMACRPCSVYGNRPCRRGDYACLKSITPQLVLERVDAGS